MLLENQVRILPGNVYLAEALTFQFVDLHYAFKFMYTQKNMRSQNSVGFPNNILLIEMLLKRALRETLFNPTPLNRPIVCRGPSFKWAEMTRFRIVQYFLCIYIFMSCVVHLRSI